MGWQKALYCQNNTVDTRGAYVLRENTGTSELERTLRDVVYILACHHLYTETWDALQAET